jgi:hypothetical protein
MSTSPTNSPSTSVIKSPSCRNLKLCVGAELMKDVG